MCWPTLSLLALRGQFEKILCNQTNEIKFLFFTSSYLETRADPKYYLKGDNEVSNMRQIKGLPNTGNPNIRWTSSKIINSPLFRWKVLVSGRHLYTRADTRLISVLIIMVEWVKTPKPHLCNNFFCALVKFHWSYVIAVVWDDVSFPLSLPSHTSSDAWFFWLYIHCYQLV